MKRLIRLCLLLIVVVFTAQNHEVIELRFLAWSVEMSRALIIFLAFCGGALVGWLMSLEMGRMGY